MNKLFPIILIVLVVAVGGYFLMKGGGSMQTSVVTTPSGPVKSFAVSGTEFAFSPNTLTVNKGDTVKVSFTNNGNYPHNFMITELNVQGKTISPGQSDTVTFTANKAGTFQYFCSVPGHKDKGMVGTITVQ